MVADTSSSFPNSTDTDLKIPKNPREARLGEAETPADKLLDNANEFSHSALHDAENKAIRAIEENVVVDCDSVSHDHSDPYNVDYSDRKYKYAPRTKKGRQLKVKNTHVFTDKDGNVTGTPTQIQCGAPDSSKEVIHHTIGTGANQAAPGNLTNMVKALAQQVYYLEQILDKILPGNLIKSTISFDDLSEIQSTNIGILNTDYTGLGGKLAFGNININSGSGYIKTHDGTSDNDVKVN